VCVWRRQGCQRPTEPLSASSVYWPRALQATPTVRVLISSHLFSPQISQLSRPPHAVAPTWKRKIHSLPCSVPAEAASHSAAHDESVGPLRREMCSRRQNMPDWGSGGAFRCTPWIVAIPVGVTVDGTPLRVSPLHGSLNPGLASFPLKWNLRSLRCFGPPAVEIHYVHGGACFLEPMPRLHDCGQGPLAARFCHTNRIQAPSNKRPLICNLLPCFDWCCAPENRGTGLWRHQEDPTSIDFSIKLKQSHADSTNLVISSDTPYFP
jgi:hypothetical protein